MTLGNLLRRTGGTAETGRPVRFQIRYKDKDGNWHRKWIEAVLLPVGETERAEAKQAAEDYCAEQKWTAKDVRRSERQLRLLAASLRDPADLRTRLAPEAELHQLRTGLVNVQIDKLSEEYGRLLLGEYPEVFTAADVKRTEEQAEDFCEGAPRSP